MSRGGSAIRFRFFNCNRNHQLQRSFQLSPQFLATTRQSRFHRSHIDFQRRRNLFVGKSFNVSQYHCFSINSSQTAQRRSQCSLAFVRQSVLFRDRGRFRLQRRDQRRLPIRLSRRIERNGRIASPPAPPAPAISRLVNRDAVNPGSQIRFTAKVTNALEGPQERFLGQVASFFAVFSQAIKQTVNLTRAFVHQRLRRPPRRHASVFQ